MVSYSTNEPIGEVAGGAVELPLFMQIAQGIENDIITGRLAEEVQAPSTNEIAAFHRINPATALRGVNHLVSTGILYKKRGIGMFVATGAREQLLAARRAEFAARYVGPLLTEARLLGLDAQQVAQIVEKEGRHGA